MPSIVPQFGPSTPRGGGGGGGGGGGDTLFSHDVKTIKFTPFVKILSLNILFCQKVML